MTDKKMTPEEHQARHKELHKMLDELVADWISDTGSLPSRGTVFDLMQWSHAQTIEPTVREEPAPLKDAVPDRPVMSRGINPIRPQRPSKELARCPECHATLETVQAKVIICPECKALFASATGEVLDRAPA